jgi:hypothetical protein
MPDITLTLDPETGSFPPATGLKPGVNYTIILEVEEHGLWFQFDRHNPFSDDDCIILRTVDGSEVHKIVLKELRETRGDYVFAPFPKLEDGQKYDLIYDPGDVGEKFYIEKNVDKNYLLSESSTNA